MKRILCITENLGSGGAERQLTGLAVMLKAAGYQVKLITYVKNQFYEQYLIDHNIDYELIETAENRYTRLYYIRKAVLQFQPDVAISFLPSVNATMCLSKLLGCQFKLIVSERSHTKGRSFKQRIIFKLYRIADYIVTNSYSEAENIGNLAPLLKSKIRTITNFVDSDRFSPVNLPHKNVDCVHIVSVGRIIPVKNIINYIYAIKKVIDSNYHICAIWVGASYDTEYYQQCTELIGKLGLKHVFKFLPATNQVVSVYRSGEIFCLPSFYEGFPNVICEAMSCGLPVVCSRVCDNPRIIEKERNGFLFDPYSIEEMTTAIISCINADRKKMSKQNREQSVLNFSEKQYVQSYINLL